jgi:hypothetical protein
MVRVRVADPPVPVQELIEVAVRPEMPITGTPGIPIVASWTVDVAVEVPGANFVVTLAQRASAAVCFTGSSGRFGLHVTGRALSGPPGLSRALEGTFQLARRRDDRLGGVTRATFSA